VENVMQDFRDGQVRYFVHFSDGDSGMRYRNAWIGFGAELEA
jgi:hypothetical protein